MSTATAMRSRTLAGVVLAVLGSFAVAGASPPEFDARIDLRLEKSEVGSELTVALLRVQPVSPARNGFYKGYLAPRVSELLRNGSEVIAPGLQSPASRPWAGDPATVQRVQKLGMRAIGGAFRRYAVERLGIDRWSFPVGGRSEGAAGVSDSTRMRFHLGFSHLAPRADLRIPVAAGRVEVSADARGRIGTTFEPTSSKFRVAAAVDARERTATIALSARF